MEAAHAPPFATRRFTRAEYDRLVELGVFQPGERLELLDGLLVVREPQSPSHATAVRLVVRALRAAFSDDWEVDSGLPVALDDDSEPEPDVSVVPGGPRDYRHAHPARPVLVVEVAESSYRVDRSFKASLYARAGILDYWIVHVDAGTLEVHREPGPDAAAPHGWRYQRVEISRPPDTVTPLAAPGATIRVADLLP